MTKQKALIFDWDTSPDETSGFTEIQLPERPLYYLNFATVPWDAKNRIMWNIDIASNDDVLDNVVMDFAKSIPAACRAAEEAFFRLLKSPQFRVV